MKQYIKYFDSINESTDSSDPLFDLVGNDALDAIFNDGKNVIILDWTATEDSLIASVQDYDSNHGATDADWEVTIDCLYIGQPELDQKLDEAGLRRFELVLYLNSTFTFSSWDDPGDYMNPGDSGTEIDDIETSITDIHVNGSEFKITVDVSDTIIDMDDDHLNDFIYSKHSKFI